MFFNQLSPPLNIWTKTYKPTYFSKSIKNFNDFEKVCAILKQNFRWLSSKIAAYNAQILNQSNKQETIVETY